MVGKRILELNDAISQLENQTGHLENGETKNIAGGRITIWTTLFIALSVILLIIPFSWAPSFTEVHIYLPGGIGSLILAWAPIRKDIQELHHESGSTIASADQTELLKRDIRRITDRWLGLVGVALTFFQQLLLV